MGEFKDIVQIGPAMAKANLQTAVYDKLAEVLPGALEKLGKGAGEKDMSPAELLALSLVIRS